MANPWLKKNPFMSMWLTTANRAASGARQQAVRAARLQVAAAQTEVLRQMVDLWAGTPRKQAGKKRRR